WCYNSSRSELASNMERTIEYYNAQLGSVGRGNAPEADPTKISWSRSLKSDFSRGRVQAFQQDDLRLSVYRPFTRQHLYLNRRWNEVVSKVDDCFPFDGAENRLIALSGSGARAGFSVLMISDIPNFHTIDTGQCFPLYLYERGSSNRGDLFSAGNQEFRQRDCITDASLSLFRSAYLSEEIAK